MKVAEKKATMIFPETPVHQPERSTNPTLLEKIDELNRANGELRQTVALQAEFLVQLNETGNELRAQLAANREAISKQETTAFEVIKGFEELLIETGEAAKEQAAKLEQLAAKVEAMQAAPAPAAQLDVAALAAKFGPLIQGMIRQEVDRINVAPRRSWWQWAKQTTSAIVGFVCGTAKAAATKVSNFKSWFSRKCRAMFTRVAANVAPPFVEVVEVGHQLFEKMKHARQQDPAGFDASVTFSVCVTVIFTVCLAGMFFWFWLL